MKGFARGLLFDLAVALILSVPLLLWLSFSPNLGIHVHRYKRKVRMAFSLLMIFWILAIVAEIVFIEEFNARFNFIAVDYLVYTQEVLSNIWQSYPVIPIFSFIFLIAGILGYSLGSWKFLSTGEMWSWRQRAKVGGLALVAVTVYSAVLNEQSWLFGVPTAQAELAKNSIYTLFAAYRHNSIDFRRFYSSLEQKWASRKIYELLKSEDAGSRVQDRVGFSRENQDSIVRNIRRVGEPKSYNVVLVLMESMSARFMKTFGSNQELTPNLDQLAKESLFFSHTYSTGTRTVRGIEAVTLSIPPTPGQSIVRREKGSDVFNIGTVFRHHGYSTEFIYGGRAYFDNMGEYFRSNGFSVLDQTQFPKEQIHFSNAWGVCDEDLFQQSLLRAQKMYEDKKPFFQFILTTSNHRPYTYPSGKVPIPSGTSREGAVQYADYSIGEYLKKARLQPWFNNTIFIFVADHNAGVAGGTQILPSDYRIPMMFYAPALLPPREVHQVASQIDLSPTLFGVLNFSYQSRFFGHDLLRTQSQRAFLATYQRVAYWQGDDMVVLSPNQMIEEYKVVDEKVSKQKMFQLEFLDLKDRSQTKESSSALENALAYYTAASDWFNLEHLRAELRFAEDENVRF